MDVAVPLLTHVQEESMDALTEKVIAFQKSNQGLNDLVAVVAPRVYWYPRHKLGWDEDSCGDFYAHFQPRFFRLLSRFKDQGKPFETYLCSVLSWELKNFARDRRRADRAWNTALRLEYPEEPAGIGRRWEEARPASLDQRAEALLENEADRRNFLALCLKGLRHMSPERMAGIAALTRTSEETLEGYIAELRSRIEPREKRLEEFRLRRNSAYSRIQLLEQELAEETDPERRMKIHDGLIKAGKRMRGAMHRMSRIMLNPTNREIAGVLGIPKGTVDSGLFWLKRKLSTVYDPCGQQSA
jgi:DNA-directed RNA polymerase specialized sigma24 family protein